MLNRPATRPDVRQQIGPMYGLPRDPLLAAIMQAVEQQKQQEQQKGQIMQTLGFGGNMSQFGAIPQGHGITAMDGKAWTRPGGTPPGIQQLLSQLLGVGQGGVRGLRDPAEASSFQLPRPGPVTEQAGNSDSAFVQNAYRTAVDQKDSMMIDFLVRNYPELFQTQMGNSGLPQSTQYRGR